MSDYSIGRKKKTQSPHEKTTIAERKEKERDKKEASEETKHDEAAIFTAV